MTCGEAGCSNASAFLAGSEGFGAIGVISIGSPMSTQDVLADLKKGWSSPRKARWSRSADAPPLRCTFSDPCAPWEDLDLPTTALPSELVAFWRLASSARLFEDVTYGQWGLEIFTPSEARQVASAEVQKRSRDYREGDLVVGRFLGDSDLLIVRADPRSDDFGCVLIALPIDRREDWYRVAENFEQFLAAFARSEGRKYWEKTAREG